MPATTVYLYRENEKNEPLLRDWLDALDKSGKTHIVDKCIVRIDRLKECGHDLCSAQSRGEAAHLRDGIYELRNLGKNGQWLYRILFFFSGQGVAVVSHGLTKIKEVPDSAIDLAIKHKGLFASNPQKYGVEA